MLSQMLSCPMGALDEANEIPERIDKRCRPPTFSPLRDGIEFVRTELDHPFGGGIHIVDVDGHERTARL